MKNLQIITLVLAILFTAFIAKAEEIKIKAELDSAVILIGDQVKLQLEVEYPSNIDVFFPIQESDSLGEFVEIIERLPLDTTEIENSRQVVKQEYIVTSFDTGHHEIPPFEFILTYNDIRDTVKSNATMLHVFTIPKIDSLMQAMQAPIDIKPPLKAPVNLKEVAPWILGSLLAAGLIFLILYALRRKKNNQPLFSFPQKPKEPAHIIALRKLDQIKEQKEWQEGKTKEFYSHVTDTLREYIENRYDIGALEQTSDETLAAFNANKDLLDSKSLDNLTRILQSADLVKFAKYEPLPDDNNLALVDAYFFVNQTKIEIQTEASEVDDDREGDDVILK